MNIFELKEDDVIIYSCYNGSYGSGSHFREDRALVTACDPGRGFLVFGGMFYYEMRNIVLHTVWRCNDDGEYYKLYDVEESHKYTVQLLKYRWGEPEYEKEARFVAKDEDELNKILKEYEEKWKPKENCLIHIEGWN